MLTNIEAERVRNMLTREELAKVIGISTRTYYHWINEECNIPSSGLIKLSKLFNVSIDYLLNNESDKTA